MKITGIIAEYNPFHKGHAYHLQKAKEITGADYLVVVQSGNFVQRGLPALVNQHTRAHMALVSGADLVLCLPSAYATASAEGFAGGAVSLLHGLGCVDALCFGSECGQLEPLETYAQILAEEPAAYQELLRAFLKQGCSYPLAQSKALHEYVSYTEDIVPCSLDDISCRYESELLNQPNNTLGIEYLKALKLQKSRIKPYTIKRISSGYHDLSPTNEYASASAIREALLCQPCKDVCGQSAPVLSDTAATQIPKAALDTLKKELTEKGPLNFDDFSSVLHYKLLSLSENQLAAYTDVSADLAARIKNLLPEYRSATSFADLLKTRQLTHTRITRALCHILLEDKQEAFNQLKALSYPCYAKILGFRKESRNLLGVLKKNSHVPIIGRCADALTLLRSDQEKKDLFLQDLFAAHIYEAAVTDKYKTPFCHEYQRQVIIVE